MKANKLKSIQVKLMLNFVILSLLLSIISGVYNYYSSSRIMLTDIRQEVTKLASAAALLIDGDLHQSFKSEQDKTSEDFNNMRSRLQTFVKETGVNDIYTLTLKGDNKTQFIMDAAVEETAEFGKEYDYLPAMQNAFHGEASADQQVYTDEWGTTLSGYAPVKNSEGTTVAIIGVDIDASRINLEKSKLLISIILNTLLNMLVIFVLSIFLSKKIVKPIHLLITRLKELSQSGGDLTKRIDIKTGDELELLGATVTEFISNIREIILHIMKSSDNVAISAVELNVSINENQKAVDDVTNSILNIATGASQQANNVDNIVLNIQNIALNMNESDKKVNIMNQSAEETYALIDSGVTTVNHLSEKTKENTIAFQRVTNVVERLVKEAEEIELVLSTISHIATQTNLLALNAAIEAARAGEHGKGFSVVAEEVRTLAEGSSKAAEEITQILKKINLDAHQASEEINNANIVAARQKQEVDETDKTFRNMTDNMEGMLDNIKYISKSFGEISKEINSITERIEDLSDISQENVAITQEVAASSEEQNAAMESILTTSKRLNDLSGELKEIVSKFIV